MIHNGTFVAQTLLRFLTLHTNFISLIEEGGFAGLSRLESLHLFLNRLPVCGSFDIILDHSFLTNVPL